MNPPALDPVHLRDVIYSIGLLTVIMLNVLTLFYTSTRGKRVEKREVTFADQFVTKDACMAGHANITTRMERVEEDVREIRDEMRNDRDVVLAAGDERARRLHIRIDGLAQLFNDKFQQLTSVINHK